jgi:hypothetical protein
VNSSTSIEHHQVANGSPLGQTSWFQDLRITNLQKLNETTNKNHITTAAKKPLSSTRQPKHFQKQKEERK